MGQKYTTDEKVYNLLSVAGQVPAYDMLGDEGVVDEDIPFTRPTQGGVANYSKFHKSIFLHMCDGNTYEISVKKISDSQYNKMIEKGIIDANKRI